MSDAASVYDSERHEWVGQCPHGDVCTGCDAAGYCTREEAREPTAASGPRAVPLYGPSHAGRTCTRWLGDHDCGKPAVRHVIWDETMENGFVCAGHLGEVGTAWSFYAMHEVGPDCAMPGSEFFIEENVCRCADELVAAAEGVTYAHA